MPKLGYGSARMRLGWVRTREAFAIRRGRHWTPCQVAHFCADIAKHYPTKDRREQEISHGIWNAIRDELKLVGRSGTRDKRIKDAKS